MVFPADFTAPDAKVETAQYAAECIARLAPARRVVVQAGGCAGLWPLALAQHFGQVYTFEPAPENFECLVQNVAGLRNIHASDCALADVRGTSGLTRPKVGAGLWRLEGDGEVDVVTLDSLFLEMPAFDALVLDVEGSEVRVLRGAERLIATHRPLLWFEYLHHTEAIDAWLSAHGYTRPERGCGGDYFSVSQVH